MAEAFSFFRHRDDDEKTTDLGKRIRTLERREENLQRALRVAGVGYWDWNLESGYWDGSIHLLEILGLEPESERTYEGYLGLVHSDDRDQLRETINDALARRTEYQTDYRIVLKDGAIRHLHEHGRLTTDDSGVSHISAVVQDDSDRQTALQQVSELAYNDSVTGLPNRKYLMGDLQQKLTQAGRDNRMAMAMIVNLDSFREVNESQGQKFGDRLLKEVGLRLEDTCGEVGLVASLGADEFVVVTGEAVHVDDLAVLAKETLRRVADPFGIAGREVHLTASIGIAVFPTDASTPGNLLQMAQMVVKRAKKVGGNDYAFYNEEMAAEVQEHAEIRGALVPALLSNSEFSLHYQPKVSIATGQIVGLEALMRWTSPKLGTISPATFIPIAEGSSMIQKLGGWIIETVCRHHRQWSASGCTVPAIAVNVAGPQLRAGFVEMVEQVLADSELKSQHIHMELTETSLIENLKSAVPLMHDLRRLGIDLSIDDFGTGYSSLKYLQMFPVNALKIDREFIQRMGEDEGSEAIVEATIALAHSLGLRVIAEGVETLEQLTGLRDLGCDEIQGYYFSRPVPAEEVPELLNSGRDLWSIG